MSDITRGFYGFNIRNRFALNRPAGIQPEIPPVAAEEDEYVDVTKDYWFLPKGRKDVGESLEDTALREGYEEVRLIRPFSIFPF